MWEKATFQEDKKHKQNTTVNKIALEKEFSCVSQKSTGTKRSA